MSDAAELVSIIVPVYNTEQYLKRCVDSILAQSYKNIEIILVDDGSADGSSAICDGYQSEYPNVKVIHKNNGGLSDTRNVGMRAANGEFIAFVDSDDCIDSRMIEYCVGATRKTSADIVGFQWQNFSDAIPRAKCGKKLKVVKGAKILPYYLIKNRLYCSVRYLYRKNIIDENGLNFDPSVRLGEDQLFIYNYVKRCKISATLSYDGYFYFNNPLSLSSGVVKQNHYCDLEVRNFILSDCSGKNKKRANAHLLKGYLAFCLKAIKYGSTCEEDIVSRYRKTVKKNIFKILFSALFEAKYKFAALSLCCSVDLTKKLLGGISL